MCIAALYDSIGHNTTNSMYNIYCICKFLNPLFSLKTLNFLHLLTFSFILHHLNCASCIRKNQHIQMPLFAPEYADLFNSFDIE